MMGSIDTEHYTLKKAVKCKKKHNRTLLSLFYCVHFPIVDKAKRWLVFLDQYFIISPFSFYLLSITLSWCVCASTHTLCLLHDPFSWFQKAFFMHHSYSFEFKLCPNKPATSCHTLQHLICPGFAWHLLDTPGRILQAHAWIQYAISHVCLMLFREPVTSFGRQYYINELLLRKEGQNVGEGE